MADDGPAEMPIGKGEKKSAANMPCHPGRLGTKRAVGEAGGELKPLSKNADATK